LRTAGWIPTLSQHLIAGHCGSRLSRGIWQFSGADGTSLGDAVAASPLARRAPVQVEN